MSNWLKQNKKPLAVSLLVFGLLFGLVLLLTLYYDFSSVDLAGLLFLSATLTCIFIAKNIFDNTKSADLEREIKQTNTTDLPVSSEELYLQLYKNSPVPYLIIDNTGQIKSANISAVRMLGEKQNNITGLDVFSRLKCEAHEHIDMILEKYKNSIPVSGEMVKIDRKDKRESWALLSLFSFADEAGEKIGLLTLVDITRQKKAEDAKSEFVSLASHQLRTPIAGMKWSAELLLVDNPDALTPRQHKYIDRLLISIRRMAVLVDDFLRVSRFELGTFRPEYTKFNPVELFNDVISEQLSRVKQKELEIKTSFDKSVNEIVTDANLLRMIVTNLYSNATKYTNQGGYIHVGFVKKDDVLRITVTDNGMGIPADDQAEIFSKLFRASNAVRNVPDGTGLGLYIIREAIAVLKGQISFTSTENMGTTFEVTLPIEDEVS